MNNIIGFLEEAPGVSSSARGGFWAIILTGIFSSVAILVVGLITYYKGVIGHESLMAIGIASATNLTSTSAVATTLKVMSKSRENKPDSSQTSSTDQP